MKYKGNMKKYEGTMKKYVEITKKYEGIMKKYAHLYMGRGTWKNSGPSRGPLAIFRGDRHLKSAHV